jgi:hypothetical protein
MKLKESIKPRRPRRKVTWEERMTRICRQRRRYLRTYHILPGKPVDLDVIAEWASTGDVIKVVFVGMEFLVGLSLNDQGKLYVKHTEWEARR